MWDSGSPTGPARRTFSLIFWGPIISTLDFSGFPVQAYAAHWIRLELDKLAESATHPPTTDLFLQSPHIPWEVCVRPGAPSVFVTVYDLLDIIQALKPEITPEEWARFGRVSSKRSFIVAKRTRTKDYSHDEQVEEEFCH